MKRYIIASYDSSMPDWLKGRAGKFALDHLKYRYAMSDAKFSKEPQEGSIPVYLLDEVYEETKRWGETYKTSAGQYVFVPDVDSGYSAYLPAGKGYRRLNTIAKSRLKDHIIDTVYMTAPSRRDIRQDRDYVDPRYDNNWEYMGQYKDEAYRYDSELGKSVRDPENDKWIMPWVGYAGAKRDKSGYVIPDPEELYSRLYTRFPDRLKTRVNEAKAILDEYYDKVNDAKERVLSHYDIRKGKSPYIGYGDNVYKSSMYKLGEVIRYYGWMYEGFEKCMEDDGSINPKKLASYMKGDDMYSIPHNTQYIDKYISQIN